MRTSEVICYRRPEEEGVNHTQSPRRDTPARAGWPVGAADEAADEAAVATRLCGCAAATFGLSS